METLEHKYRSTAGKRKELQRQGERWPRDEKRFLTAGTDYLDIVNLSVSFLIP